MIEISSAQDPRILEFTQMRDRVLHDKNLVVCESEKLFLQFIHSGKKILKTFSTKKFAEKYKLTNDTNFIAEREILECVAGFKIEFEILFLIHRPEDFPLTSLHDRMIVLNGVSSPENVGSIVRSEAAFNINTIITDEKSCSPFLRRCIRVSMGNIFAMKTHHAKNIRENLKELRALGYTVISTANIERSIDMANYQFPEKCILIIGSEGHGIDHDLLDFSDVILKIQINPQVAHLNAANAASIFLFHMSLAK
jgi:tRNA G18 (ribose-2'-O)-methylase SpoU